MADRNRELVPDNWSPVRERAVNHPTDGPPLNCHQLVDVLRRVRVPG